MPTSNREPHGAPATDLKQVAALAACGLTLQEVTAELGVPSKLPRKHREAFEIAFKRGRASGIARVKQAQFAAALEGKTSAQAELLKRLGGADLGGGRASH